MWLIWRQQKCCVLCVAHVSIPDCFLPRDYSPQTWKKNTPVTKLQQRFLSIRQSETPEESALSNHKRSKCNSQGVSFMIQSACAVRKQLWIMFCVPWFASRSILFATGLGTTVWGCKVDFYYTTTISNLARSRLKSYLLDSLLSYPPVMRHLD